MGDKLGKSGLSVLLMGEDVTSPGNASWTDTRKWTPGHGVFESIRHHGTDPDEALRLLNGRCASPCSSGSRTTRAAVLRKDCSA